jgi:hypothetical protein
LLDGANQHGRAERGQQRGRQGERAELPQAAKDRPCANGRTLQAAGAQRQAARAVHPARRRPPCVSAVPLATITGQPSGTSASVESRPGFSRLVPHRQHFRGWPPALGAGAAALEQPGAITADRGQAWPRVSHGVAAPKE